ncbi:hypothetical protein V1502_10705 [Bacillus sp. SCS-153A]|uniref:hypothetical protein n=1 Tax=Rossellomorea sedimentorum TaxID=3115294 RepID=UPI003905F379
MRNSYYISLLASCILSILITSLSVTATSWVELEPQEVVNRAEVIVMGTYDFTSEPKPSDFIFQGFEFTVNSVYKGDPSKQFTAGIDYNDTGWAEDFQNKGGVFLLFLEKSTDADFLIPVGGPNGMIQVYEGEIENITEEKRDFFEEFLKSHTEKTIVREVETPSNVMKEISYLLLSVGIFVGGLFLFLLYRRKRKQ